jgi:hypothetical protein
VLLANQETTIAGFDVGDPSFITFDGAKKLVRTVPTRVVPAAGNFDVMGYCNPSWMSDYTYKKLYGTLFLTTGSGGTGGGPPAPPATPQLGDWLMVFGDILPSRGASNLALVRRMDRVAAIPPRVDGSHEIQLVGDGGAILARHAFQPERVAETGAPLARFGQVVPFAAGTREVRVADRTTGATLAARTVSRNAPAIAGLTLRAAPQPVTGAVVVEWTASDADGDALTFDVLLARADGASLQPVVHGATGRSATIDTASFAGGPARLRVLASDGVLTAFADTEPFTIASKPPRPRIHTPEDGARVQWGQLVNLSGDAWDPQDGGIPASRLSWSDARGALGTGPLLSLTELPVGTHVVRFTAVNSLGLSATATVTITVGDDLTLPGPTLTAGPALIAWHVTAGQTELQREEVAIGNSGSGPLRFIARADAPWLALGATSGDAPAVLQLFANPSGIAPGSTVEATLTLSVDGAPDRTVTIPVRLSVGNTFFGVPPPAAPAESVRWAGVVDPFRGNLLHAPDDRVTPLDAGATLGDFGPAMRYPGLERLLGLPGEDLARADVVAFEANGGKGAGIDGGWESSVWTFTDGVNTYVATFNELLGRTSDPSIIATGTIKGADGGVSSGGAAYASFFGACCSDSGHGAVSYILFDLHSVAPRIDASSASFTITIRNGARPDGSSGEGTPEPDAVGVLTRCGPACQSGRSPE